jgi:hypothetical protein
MLDFFFFVEVKDLFSFDNLSGQLEILVFEEENFASATYL